MSYQHVAPGRSSFWATSSCPFDAPVRRPQATFAWASALIRNDPGASGRMVWGGIATYSGAFPCLGDLDNDGRVDFLLYCQGPRTTPGYVSRPQRLWLVLQGVSRALETTETAHCGQDIRPGARRGGGAVLKCQRGVPESASGLP